MADEETIKRRVRALLAKKHGGTEAEIASALAMAKKLMGEWRLTEADLTPQEQTSSMPIQEMRLKPRATPPKWELQIALICAELFQVKAFVRTEGWPEKKVVCFVGFPADLELAVETYSELKAQILGLCTKYTEATGCRYAERCIYGMAIVQRLLQKVESSKMAAKAEDDAKCRALVVSRKEEIDKHLAEKMGVKFAKPRRPSVAQWVKDRIAQESVHWKRGVKDSDKVQFGLGRKKLEGE